MLNDNFGQITQEVINNTVILGDDADKFFKDDLGQYVIERSKTEMFEALHEMMVADPTNLKQMEAIKIKLLVAQSVPRWLNDAITSGRHMLESITENFEE